MMRYKNLVFKNLEQVDVLLNVVVTSMDNQTIDPQEAYNKIKQAVSHLHAAMEKVSLEPDQNS